MTTQAQKPPDPGFADTAAYFEARAKKARELDDQSRLLEVAGFYRSLAQIVPGLPAGYKTNGASPPISRAERWQARARECRTLADHYRDPQCHLQLTRLAETYDRLASMAEGRDRPPQTVAAVDRTGLR